MSGFKRRTLKRYNLLGGELYDLRYKEEQKKKYSLILKHLEITKDKIILDNGCGTGLLFEELSDTIIGLDISEKLLEKAIQRLRPSHHLIQGDADNLPIRPKIFDIVFSVTVLQNMPYPQKTVGEIERVLKNRGELVLSVIKKAYNFEDVQNILRQSGLILFRYLIYDEIKDWIALFKKK